MRAVIYARYSSDNQREASIDDQVEVCRRLIDREGWEQCGRHGLIQKFLQLLPICYLKKIGLPIIG